MLESQALRLLDEVRPGILVVDELHSLQAGSVREQSRFLNLLRFLGNELRIPLVCLGTQAARNALRTDEQLVRRFEAFALPPWQCDEHLERLVGALLRTLPLRRPSQVGERSLQRLVAMTDGITAGIFKVITKLAAGAIATGEERITGADIEDEDRMAALLGEPV